MNKKTKKSLWEYGIILVIIGTLYFSGYHTEVIGLIQRGFLATGLMNPDLEGEGERKGSEVPTADFSLDLTDSSGEALALEDLRGKVIFINLWATWCPPCVAEMPGINDLYNQVDKESIVFLMLSLDEDFEKARKYVNQKEFDFEIYQLKGSLPEMYRSESIPTTFVINAKGQLVLTHLGMGNFNNEKFKDFLEKQR